MFLKEFKITQFISNFKGNHKYAIDFYRKIANFLSMNISFLLIKTHPNLINRDYY